MSFAETQARAIGFTTYSQHDQRQISLRRHRTRKYAIGVDRLLALVGVQDTAQVYPPSTKEAFIQLVADINNSKACEEFKSRAIFYLFLDFSNPEQLNVLDNSPTREITTVAEYYASQIWMPVCDQALVTALWFLDHNLPERSVELLGQPFDLYGCSSLNEYIVMALADQKSSILPAYLAVSAAQDLSERFLNELARSLLLKGKFAEVLSLSRRQGNFSYLVDMAKVAVDSKELCIDLVQQPFTPNEWNVVSEELKRIIGNASPTLKESSVTSNLANNILLVRALNTGDIKAIRELSGTGEAADFFIPKYAPDLQNRQVHSK